MHTLESNGTSGTKRFKEHVDKCSPMSSSIVSSSISTDSSSLSLNSSLPNFDLSLLYFNSPSLMTSSLTQSALNHIGFKKLKKINENVIKRIKTLCVDIDEVNTIFE